MNKICLLNNKYYSVKATNANSENISQINSLEGKSKNLLKATTLFTACFIQVFFGELLSKAAQNDHFWVAPRLAVTCSFNCINNLSSWLYFIMFPNINHPLTQTYWVTGAIVICDKFEWNVVHTSCCFPCL